MRGFTVVTTILLMMEGSLDFKTLTIAFIRALSRVFPYILMSILSVCTNIYEICKSNPMPSLHLGWVNCRSVSHYSLVMVMTSIPFCLMAVPILN